MEAILVENLSKTYAALGGVRLILKQISLSVPKGQSVAVLGPNGAGKTTLLKLILNLIPPLSGSVKIFGFGPGSSRARQCIGFLAELPTTADFLNREQFLDLFAPGNQRNSQNMQEIKERLIANIPPNQPMGQYSKGMVQRLNFARVLQNDPELIFLDEPISGLDPIGQLKIMEILQALRRAGKTLYINTHNIDFALETADRILVLNQGVILMDKPVLEIHRQELVDLFLSLSGEKS